MSRVVKKPRYTDELKAVVLLGEDELTRRHGGLLAGAYRLGIDRNDDVAHYIAKSGDLSHIAARLHHAGLTDIKGNKMKIGVGINTIARRYGIGPSDISTDDSAVFRVFGDLLNEKMAVSDECGSRLVISDLESRPASICGVFASKVHHLKAIKKCKSVRLFSALANHYPHMICLMGLARELRGGYSSSSSGKLFRTSDQLDFRSWDCITRFAQKKHSLGKYLTGAHVYTFASILIIVVPEDKEMFVFDSESAFELAQCLWMTGMLHVYGMNYHDEHGKGAGVNAMRSVVRYVAESLKEYRNDINKLRRISRHIKTAYTARVILCGKDKEEDPVSIECQARDLNKEAMSEPHIDNGFLSVLRKMDDNIAVDFGQIWQIMPCPDCDIRMTNESLKEKFWKPRNYSEEAWEDFLAYSIGVMAATIITEKHADANKWKWAGPSKDPLNLPWVKSCLSGRLMYPPRCSKLSECNYPLAIVPWSKHLESWKWTVSDVTHVMADKETPFGTDKFDGNELLYTLKHGGVLSKRYSPEEVRECMASGFVPGDRVGAIAVKAENAKFPGKQRDTHSGDDVMRELLSELDINIASIIQAAGGVAMRAGRKHIETKMGSICATAEDGSVIISLDVSGWSPNAPREKELAFIDMMMQFFSAPKGFLAGNIFKDYWVVAEKRGYSDVWDSKNGSIQGFFGGCDSVMHSLMMRWAFVRARESKKFKNDSTINSEAMIDDMICRIRNSDSGKKDILETICENYASLGYEVDKVKTMISNVKGSFLNRVYMTGLEVITASKTFSKIDQPWEPAARTCWQTIDGIFGAAIGASDRGADPIVCYMACMALMFDYVKSAGVRRTLNSIMATGVVIWIPRQLGGYGIPNTIQWLTRESLVSLESSIHNTISAISLIEMFDETLVPDCLRVMMAYVKRPLAKRSIATQFDDPFGVKADGIPDPAGCIRRASASVVEKLMHDNSWQRLIKYSSSDAYKAVLEDVMEHTKLPGAGAGAFAESLPHHVVNALISRFESNDSIYKAMPHVTRREMHKELNTLNRMALTSWITDAPEVDVFSPADLSAQKIAEDLRYKQQIEDGSTFCQLSCPSVLDSTSIARSEVDTLIQVTMGSAQNMFSGVKGDSIHRTDRSRGIFEPRGNEARQRDPVLSTYEKISAACSAMIQNGISCGILIEAYSLLWTGNRDSIRITCASVRTANPFRVYTRLTKRNYTVMAFPNTIARTVVRIGGLATLMDKTAHPYDLLAFVHTFKAWSALEKLCEPMATLPDVVNFNLRAAATLDYTNFDIAAGSPTLLKEHNLKGALGIADVSVFVNNIANVTHKFVTDFEVEGVIGANDSLAELSQQTMPVTRLSQVSATRVIRTLAVRNVGQGILADIPSDRVAARSDLVSVNIRSKNIYQKRLKLETDDPGATEAINLLAVFTNFIQGRGSRSIEEFKTRAANIYPKIATGALKERVKMIMNVTHNNKDDTILRIKSYLDNKPRTSVKYYADAIMGYNERLMNFGDVLNHKTLSLKFKIALMQEWVSVILRGGSLADAVIAVGKAADSIVTMVRRRDIPHFNCTFGRAEAERLSIAKELGPEHCLRIIQASFEGGKMDRIHHFMIHAIAGAARAWVTSDWVLGREKPGTTILQPVVEKTKEFDLGIEIPAFKLAELTDMAPMREYTQEMKDKFMAITGIYYSDADDSMRRQYYDEVAEASAEATTVDFED